MSEAIRVSALVLAIYAVIGGLYVVAAITWSAIKGRRASLRTRNSTARTNRVLKMDFKTSHGIGDETE